MRRAGREVDLLLLLRACVCVRVCVMCVHCKKKRVPPPWREEKATTSEKLFSLSLCPRAPFIPPLSFGASKEKLVHRPRQPHPSLIPTPHAPPAPTVVSFSPPPTQVRCECAPGVARERESATRARPVDAIGFFRLGAREKRVATTPLGFSLPWRWT
jgi:hypothetical protein